MALIGICWTPLRGNSMGTRSPTVQPLASATVSFTARPPEARSSSEPAVTSVLTTCPEAAGGVAAAGAGGHLGLDALLVGGRVDGREGLAAPAELPGADAHPGHRRQLRLLGPALGVLGGERLGVVVHQDLGA